MSCRKPKPQQPTEIFERDAAGIVVDSAGGIQNATIEVITLEEAEREMTERMRNRLGHPVRHEEELDTRELRVLET